METIREIRRYMNLANCLFSTNTNLILIWSSIALASFPRRSSAELLSNCRKLGSVGRCWRYPKWRGPYASVPIEECKVDLFVWPRSISATSSGRAGMRVYVFSRSSQRISLLTSSLIARKPLKLPEDVNGHVVETTGLYSSLISIYFAHESEIIG